jgi:hypothetical protein
VQVQLIGTMKTRKRHASYRPIHRTATRIGKPRQNIDATGHGDVWGACGPIAVVRQPWLAGIANFDDAHSVIGVQLRRAKFAAIV